MSVPFSNTNLRIPKGFGNLLEGLAKEVLRDQPEDIPTFAALYFSELLKTREESGLDPAEWGARLEDRFYNNHTFKVQETATQGSFSSSKANTSSSTGDTTTYGNNRSQQSNGLNANNSSDNLDGSEVKKKYELDIMKLDEESGNAEHGPAAEISGRTDVDICDEEVSNPSEIPGQVSENTDTPRDNKIDVCRSELDPTPLPSFGGLANVNVCAEEINPRLTEDNKEPKSQDVQNLPESLIETPSHIDHDKVKQADEMSDDENTEEPETYDQIKNTEQDVSNITDSFLDDTGLEEESTEMVYLEESTERTNAETRITSTTEAGTEKRIEEKEELLDSEDQEVNHEYSSYIDIVEDEPAGETTGMKDTYIVYSGETYDSRSDIIDVLDEVVMGSELEAEDNTDEHSFSKIMDALEEEELLESQTNALEPDSQLSDTEVTEDVAGKEVLNTDVMDTSEKDPVTETINEASDLDSDCFDAEEIDQDDVVKVEEDPTKSTTFDDLSSMREQYIMTTVDVTNDSELKEDVLAFETEREAEVTDEHHMEEQEQSEQAEHLKTDEDQGDPFGDEEDKNHATNLDSENPEQSEEKEECNQPHEEEDIMDIPLDDPEANKAAAKIQAGFRGHMTRKKMKPDEKTGDEVSSSGEALNGSEGDTAGGTDEVETDTTSGPEQ